MVAAAGVVCTATTVSAAAGSSSPFIVVKVHAGAAPAFSLATQAASAPCMRSRAAILRSALPTAAFDAMAAAPGVRRLIFFVPGFATNVGAALRDARRIRTVLDPGEMLVVVDWGSRGKKTHYEADARTARASAPEFATLLGDVHDALPRTEIDVFAHSMGARLTVRAISVIPVRPHAGTIVQRAVLAAPDMTIADYKHAIARDPVPVGHVTVYASRFDKALLVSTMIHLHRRLGRLRAWRKPLARTDVVDASVASHGMDGHGYAITDPGVLRDIAATLAGAPVPHADWGHAKHDAVSWTYKPLTRSSAPRPCKR